MATVTLLVTIPATPKLEGSKETSFSIDIHDVDSIEMATAKLDAEHMQGFSESQRKRRKVTVQGVSK